MASLFDAIVLQNLSVLTRGHTLRPHVLLLGGPNSFIRGMREAWQANIPRMWQERKVEIPDGAKPEDLIKVPQNAQYFAALGAIEFGKSEEDCVGCYQGYEKLVHYIDFGRQEEKAKSGANGLTTSDDGTRRLQGVVPPQEVHPRDLPRHTRRSAASSASTAVRLRPKPCCSTKKATFFASPTSSRTAIRFRTRLKCSRTCAARSKRRSAKLEVLGVATTGYAKDILKDVLNADVALVETVAHTESALKFYDDPHVIVDVGGQDIKIIILHNGRVKDFKLNTQCSAGNGYFLQSTAEGFGLSVEAICRSRFLRPIHAGFRLRLRRVHAIGHREFPAPGLAGGGNSRGPGRGASEECVPLRRQHSEPRGAGHALRPARWHAEQYGGREGGSRFHPQQLPRRRQEAGNHRSRILRRIRRDRRGGRSRCACGATACTPSFVGLDAVRKIEYRTTRNEDTRCNFCKNNCLRTFIDINEPLLRTT